MISSNDLDKCITMLADISNSVSSYDAREEIAEIAQILKKEYDIVVAIERQRESRNVSIGGLIGDNVQLFQENQKLLSENLQLKTMLESRVNSIASKVDNVSRNVCQVNELIASLR